MNTTKRFEDYKEKTLPIYKDRKGSIQRTVPINAIAKDGIFELEKRPKGADRTYDKAYLFVDTNYVTRDEDERLQYLELWCKCLNMLNVSFKIIVMNNRRDIKRFADDVFIKHSEGEDEARKGLVDAINGIIEGKAKLTNAGIEQVKILVVSCRRQDFATARSYFRTIEASLKANFKRMDSGLIALDAEERLRLLHAFYRMGKEELFTFDFDETAKKPNKDWLNSFCCLSIKENEDSLTFEDREVAALFVREFPQSRINDEFITQLTALPFHVTVTVDCSPIPKPAVIKKLNDAYMANGRAIEKQREFRKKNQQYDSEITFERREEKEEIERDMEIARNNDENMFYCGIYILVTAPDKETLASHIVAIQSIGEAFSMTIEPHTMRQLAAMNTALPTGAREVDTMRPLFTEPLAALCPFAVQELYEPGGLYYGTNQISKNVLIGDRKRLMNGNGFILGVTGSGKSVHAKMEMMQAAAIGKDDVIIIDPMNEYAGLVESMRGQFIYISSQTKNYINPLSIDNRKLFESLESFIADKSELVLGIAEQAMDREITAAQKSIIVRCVQILYHRVFDGVKKPEEPTMHDLYDVLGEQEETEAKELRLSLELFIKGSLNIFSHKGNVDADNRIVCYGIGDLGNDLAPIGMLVMLEAIRGKIVRNSRRGRATWLFIDEFHRLAGQTFSAKFLEKIWKEVRKMGGLATGITQNITDLLTTKTVTTMLSNSEYIALLQQSDYDRETIGPLLGLSSNMLDFVKNSEKGCGILKFGRNKVIPFDNTIPKDTEVYRLVNTNFHEIHADGKKKEKLTAKKAKAAVAELERAEEAERLREEGFTNALAEEEKTELEQGAEEAGEAAAEKEATESKRRELSDNSDDTFPSNLRETYKNPDVINTATEYGGDGSLEPEKEEPDAETAEGPAKEGGAAERMAEMLTRRAEEISEAAQKAAGAIAWYEDEAEEGGTGAEAENRPAKKRRRRRSRRKEAIEE